MYITGVLKSSNEKAAVNANKIEYVKMRDYGSFTDFLIKLDNGEELSVDDDETIKLLKLIKE